MTNKYEYLIIKETTKANKKRINPNNGLEEIIGSGSIFILWNEWDKIIWDNESGLKCDKWVISP